MENTENKTRREITDKELAQVAGGNNNPYISVLGDRTLQDLTLSDSTPTVQSEGGISAPISH